MDGLFGYIAVFILGIVFGAIFMKKTGAGNNGGNGGGGSGLLGRFGMNRNQNMQRPPQGNNMMNPGMQRPGMNPMQQRPGMMPGQNNQPQGGFGQQPNNNQNNGGW
jgi:hypothetical protein